jgi:hypothetical protein
MKLQPILAVTVIFAFAGVANAGSLNVPNVFVSGEAARAAEVNENFNAVKTEVDDNNARIDVNASGLSFKQERVTGSCVAGEGMRVINVDGSVSCAPSQDRVTGTCPAGEYMRVINANGSVVCESDTDTTYSNGVGLNLNATTREFSINPLETQSRGTNTECTGTDKVAQLLQNGDVVCEADVDTDTTYSAGTGMQLDTTTFRPADGFVSVPYSAFVATNVSATRNTAPTDTGASTVAGVIIGNGSHTHTISAPRSITIPEVCHLSPQLSNTGAYTFFEDSGAANCDAFAPLSLPHNASISSLSCKVFDNFPSNSLQAHLYRVPLTGAGSTQELVLSSNPSTNQPDPQSITALAPAPSVALVENNNYAYHLQMIWETSTLGDEFRVYGCSVGYSYI